MSTKFMFAVIINSFIIYRFVSSNSCQTRLTCDECIRDSAGCIYCAREKYSDTRCRSAAEVSDDWCVDNRINPQSEIEVLDDVNFSSELGKVVQIKPQKITMTLRPKIPNSFKFFFKPAKNYPVDLYFLLDGSTSMEEMKDKTLSQAQNIFEVMRNLTKKVHFGMGTFIDKNVLPYTQSINSTLTYSFRNQLKLTDVFEDFHKTLSATKFGINFDNPEGTFDALAQVLVCEDEIGWRKESFKIVVVVTDAVFHSVGDGKMAGIEQPYDGKCYTKNDIYTKEIKMDYPSVGIINKLASNEEIVILFVVKSDIFNDYNYLTSLIRGSYVTDYEQHSEIVSILENLYKNIIQNIKLKVNIEAKYREQIKVTFDPNCKVLDKQKCSVQQDKDKEIIATIELLNYIEAEYINIIIMLEGIKEHITVTVKPIKECNCIIEEESKICNSMGKLKCGICECKSDRYGEYCECNKNAGDASIKSQCIFANSTNVVCNGHGQCRCGQCFCLEGYLGKYCECHKTGCPTHEGLVCAGKGQCTCKVCECQPGFTGKACECPTSKQNCIDENSEICSNRGECVCGQCECEKPAAWDAREQDNFCKANYSDSSSFRNRQCQILEPIALRYTEQDNYFAHPEIHITHTSNVTYVVNQPNETWYRCPQFRVAIRCYKEFIYKYNDDHYGVDLVVQSSANCAENYILIGCTCLLAIVIATLGGLGTWKCVVSRRDRREYERFLAEVKQASSSADNPIYNKPTTTFENPICGQPSIRR